MLIIGEQRMLARSRVESSIAQKHNQEERRRQRLEMHDVRVYHCRRRQERGEMVGRGRHSG